MFEECMSKASAKKGRDGIVTERDEAPPGSILNANIAGFWLSMDLLDIVSGKAVDIHVTSARYEMAEFDLSGYLWKAKYAFVLACLCVFGTCRTCMYEM